MTRQARRWSRAKVKWEVCRILPLPAGETVIRLHDTLVVYGKPTEVSALDAGGITVTGEITDA